MTTKTVTVRLNESDVELLEKYLEHTNHSNVSVEYLIQKEIRNFLDYCYDEVNACPRCGRSESGVKRTDHGDFLVCMFCGYTTEDDHAFYKGS